MRSQQRFGSRALLRARRIVIAAGASCAITACDGSRPTQPPAPQPETALNASGSPFPVEFFVQAHQDDWQLFLGDRAVAAVPTAAKIVFVYTTAGDAGSPTSDGYWQARERAAQASIDSMTATAVWSCANQTLNTHVIRRCAKGNTVSYYMRLPDGNGEGQGYPPVNGSLARLRSGAISSLAAVDGSTTYASWNDLLATFNALVTFEAAGYPDANLAVHAPDDDREVNGSDHSDHLATGDLARDAAAARPWNLFWYMGYQSMYEARNLTAAQHAAKWELIVAYDDVLKGDYGTIIGTSHSEAWSERTVFRAEFSTGEPPPPATVPGAPTALQAATPDGTRIDLTWTDNSTDEQGFRIERAPDAAGFAGTFVEVGVVSANVTSYASTDVSPDSRYWFRVRAYNVAGSSEYTNEASAILAIPDAPTSLLATAISGTSPGTFGSAVTLGADVTAYRVTGLAATTTYWFRIRAQNSLGNSAYTPPVSVTTMTVVPPSELYLVGTTRNVDLRWVPGSALTVDIYRNGTRIVSGRTNDGGPYNNRPAASLGSSIAYQVCAAGKTDAANCSAVVNATF